jgi:hypothetical protein
MTTAYDASIRLVLWGDALQPTDVARQLKLAPQFCETKVKGEVLKRPDGTSTGSVAKTGMLIYNCALELPNKRHDPEAQMVRIADLLRPLPDAFFASNGVQQAQLQMFFYYEKSAPGEPDFFVPLDLMAQAMRHAIQLSVSILP